MFKRLLSIFPLWFLIGLNQAAAECDPQAGKVVSVQGQVEIQHVGQPSWGPAQLEEILCPGDSVRVAERSRAAILLANETLLRLDQHSTVAFPTPEKAATSWLDVIKGTIYLISRAPRPSQVNTPFVTAALRGTEFLVRVSAAETLIAVYEGEVLASNAAGSLTLTSNQTGVAQAGKAPVRQIMVRPRDAVQWALYYPPVIDARAKVYQTGPAAPMLQATLARYRQNDLGGAFATLDTIPAKLRDERYYTLQAQLLLLVGRVDEARSAIDQALSRNPANATALALQAIITVVQNDKEQALRLAEQAVKREPQSPVPYIALSYVQQAHFAIDKALASVQEAVRLNPENALAWARLAELQLSKGELDRALDAAQEAVARNPNLARTQSVLGFAYLTRIDIEKAKATFNDAIKLDQADPLPRLGLGLAKIRKGYLQEGREEIEIATGLDPSNSLIRSYLGKTYFEEKRDKLSADQLAMAKDLDPKDPTPWFYDAIRKQTENQPVEALRDLEKSIELNDNRAVYRSRLLLDEDLAARGATLGRIYNDLGFEQLALVEGWGSVNTDPANYSAHRLLADSYSALPRHEVTQVSELLQSQLLQPINITPVQPLLPLLPKQAGGVRSTTGQTRSVTNSLILGSAGPISASFNEYHPLFVRNRLLLQASGIAGSNDTLGDELLLSGVQGPTSFSLGQFHYDTDGFHRGDRNNTDIKQNIYNAFVQSNLTNDTSLQAEFRYFDTEQGDPNLRFDPKNFSPKLRQRQRAKIARFGIHQALTPASDLIGSFVFRNSDFAFSDSISFSSGLDINFDFDQQEDSYLGELQYLFNSEQISVTSGGGYATGQSEDLASVELRVPGESFVEPPTSTSTDIRHANLYSYTQFNFLRNFHLTLGLSADFFEISEKTSLDRNQVNPKIGLLWTVSPETTLRLAAFRVLKRTLPSNQTLEPTQVVGFSQFFDDPDGTETWKYGTAIDHKFTPNLYGGMEFSKREMTIPLSAEEGFDSTSSEERLGRAYLYWTPHSWLALSAEYNYERIINDIIFLNGFSEAKTQWVPLGISVFHPSGLALRFNSTYVHQSGDFISFDGTPFHGKDDFWMLNASLDYRLPKRRGFLTLGVKNLLDTDFRYQDTDLSQSPFQPERQVFGRLTLVF